MFADVGFMGLTNFAKSDAAQLQMARHRSSRHTCHSNRQPLIVQSNLSSPFAHAVTCRFAHCCHLSASRARLKCSTTRDVLPVYTFEMFNDMRFVQGQIILMCGSDKMIQVAFRKHNNFQGRDTNCSVARELFKHLIFKTGPIFQFAAHAVSNWSLVSGCRYVCVL